LLEGFANLQAVDMQKDFRSALDDCQKVFREFFFWPEKLMPEVLAMGK